MLQIFGSRSGRLTLFVRLLVGVLSGKASKAGNNVQFSKASPFHLSQFQRPGQDKLPTHFQRPRRGQLFASRATILRSSFAACGRTMRHDLRPIQCGLSFSHGRAEISTSRYMSQTKPSPRPNLSFNSDPTVRDFGHALDFRLSVGPVNFVR